MEKRIRTLPEIVASLVDRTIWKVEFEDADRLVLRFVDGSGVLIEPTLEPMLQVWQMEELLPPGVYRRELPAEAMVGERVVIAPQQMHGMGCGCFACRTVRDSKVGF